MIPQPGKALTDLAQKLALSVAPEIDSAYGAANVGMISMLLLALGQEAECAISNRLQDAEELRALFEAAGESQGQAARETFATSQPASMNLSDVTAWLDEGLALLIDLHAWAEDNDSTLNSRIWDFLYHHTERHKIDL